MSDFAAGLLLGFGLIGILVGGGAVFLGACVLYVYACDRL